jgi:hypothetical protein
MAAMRASWIMGPRTRGSCAIPASTVSNSGVSESSASLGEPSHASTWLHACAGVLAASFQMRGFVTTLMNS